MDYQYKVGMLVGLLARVTDTHDKGNIVMLVEGTDLHVQLSEAVLLGGVDLIHAKLQEKAEAEAAAAGKAEAAEALRVKVDQEILDAAEPVKKSKRERPAAGVESGPQSA